MAKTKSHYTWKCIKL